MNWRTLATILITGATLIIWSVWLQRDTDRLNDTVAQAPRGYYLKDARIRQTGRNGDARYTLNAQHIEQNPNDNQISLEQVVLDYRSDSGATWQLSADTGVLDDTTQRASFAGTVLIRPTAEPGATTRLTTESLQVDMNAQRASTRDAVVLQMDDQRLTARGLQANLMEQTVKLESQVHGVFQIESGLSAPGH